jgi:hypothetical protein
MKWIVENIPELTGFTVEWAEDGNYYLSRRNRLYHSTDLNLPFKEIAVIDAPIWKQLASNFRLAQRLLRFMVTNVIPLKSGDLFVTFDKSVGIVRDGNYRDLMGLERPCRVLRSACAIDDNRDIFFGEYLANKERGEIRIYRYSQGSNELEIAYTFPSNSIKHIHGLYFDEFTRSIFCLTGDDENECMILRSFDGFKTIEIIGQGDESWRAVSIVFDPDHFYYGTDAEYRAHHIYKVDRRTLKRENLGEVGGTVFYSKRSDQDLFFTTTAENAPSQKENVASVWHINPEGKPEEIIKFRKDAWHSTLFMFGTIHFPYSNLLEDKIYFSIVGLKGDNQTFNIGSTV